MINHCHNWIQRDNIVILSNKEKDLWKELHLLRWMLKIESQLYKTITKHKTNNK
jgi:hypothetical protein